jgi:putative flippase GtrA
VAASLADRLMNRRAAGLFVRNTIVSCAAFAFDLALLWVLIERGGMDKLPAAALAFVAANSLHYVFGRAWVFRGSERGLATGYLYFLINACVGLTITLLLFMLIVDGLGIHYLIARVLASVFAGLAVFVLNAVLNFRCL